MPSCQSHARVLRRRVALLAQASALAFLVSPLFSTSGTAGQLGHPDIEVFFDAAAADERVAALALGELEDRWRVGYAGMLWDLARFQRPPGPHLLSFIRLISFLERQTGQSFGPDLLRWQQWIWNQPYDPHPDYARFKGILYGRLDPRFEDFFPPGVESRIRLDEIDWGGVPVNGIPPLEHPRHVTAAEAGYLADDHIVFGVAVDGEARAYPKRILAWHEMALDRVGGIELTIVYCTLCGTVIPFESVVDGQHLTFGTSGLLYRSNKLMFDRETRSLWNTFQGEPVVGPLVGRGVRLSPHAVVTTTWADWSRTHPETTVLSLDTGYRRDYSEGAAYRSYFSTDALMFPVSRTDARLKNKDEVLVMQLEDPSQNGRRQPVAISASFLRRHRVFHHQAAGRHLVVVTSPQGANRVYDAQDDRYLRHLDRQHLSDDRGRTWRITEEALVLEGDSDTRRVRVPAQRAFWFGWYAQFPETELIR